MDQKAELEGQVAELVAAGRSKDLAMEELRAQVHLHFTGYSQ